MYQKGNFFKFWKNLKVCLSSFCSIFWSQQIKEFFSLKTWISPGFLLKTSPDFHKYEPGWRISHTGKGYRGHIMDRNCPPAGAPGTPSESNFWANLTKRIQASYHVWMIIWEQNFLAHLWIRICGWGDDLAWAMCWSTVSQEAPLGKSGIPDLEF